MRITVELSLYPLGEDYVPLIRDFIARLKSHSELDIITNAISTQIVGEHAHVFEVLSKETATTFSAGHSVDDCSRECLKMVVDTSLSGKRVIRELSSPVTDKGVPKTIVSDNRIYQSCSLKMGSRNECGMAIHSARQTNAKWLHRKF